MDTLKKKEKLESEDEEEEDNVVSVSTGGTWKREEAEKDNVSDSVSIETFEDGDNNRKRTCILVLLALLLLAVALIPLVFHLIQKDPTEKIIGLFQCEVTLVRINYTRAMGDNSSQDFKNLSRIFKAEISYLYQVNGTQLAYRKSRVNTLTKGSVVVQYDMFFNMVDGKLPTRNQLLDVLLSVERDLLEPNLGVLGDLRFKINSAKVEDSIKLNMNKFTDFKDDTIGRRNNDVSSSESVDDSFVTNNALGTTDVNVVHEDSSEIATPENMAWGRLTKGSQQKSDIGLTTTTVSYKGNVSAKNRIKNIDNNINSKLESNNVEITNFGGSESRVSNDAGTGNVKSIVEDKVSNGSKGLLGAKVQNGVGKSEESLLLTPRMTEILQYLTTTERYKLKTLPIPRLSDNDSLESDTANETGTKSENVNTKTIDQEVKLFTFQNGTTINITDMMASSLQDTTFDVNQTYFLDNVTTMFSTTFVPSSTNTLFDATTDAMNESLAIDSNSNRSIDVMGLDTNTVHETETHTNSSNSVRTVSNNSSSYFESGSFFGESRNSSSDPIGTDTVAQQVVPVGVLSSVVNRNSDKLSVAALTKIDDINRGNLAITQPISETISAINETTLDVKSQVESNVKTSKEVFRVNFNNFWPIIVDGDKGVTAKTDTPLTLEPLDNSTSTDITFNISDSNASTTIIDFNQISDGKVLQEADLNLLEESAKVMTKDQTMVMLKVDESNIDTNKILPPGTAENVSPNPSEVYIIGTFVPFVGANADLTNNFINDRVKNLTASESILSGKGSTQLSETEKSVLGNIFGSNIVNLEKKLYNSTSQKFADAVLLETIGNESYVDLSVDNRSVIGTDSNKMNDAFDYSMNKSMDIKKTGQSIGRFTVVTNNEKMTTPKPNMRLFVEELTTQILNGMNQNKSAVQVMTETKSEISNVNVSNVVMDGKIDQTLSSTGDIGVVSGGVGQSDFVGLVDVATDPVIIQHSEPTIIFEQKATGSHISTGSTQLDQKTQIIDLTPNFDLTPNIHKFTSPSTLITATDLGPATERNIYTGNTIGKPVSQHNIYSEDTIGNSGTSLNTQDNTATKTNTEANVFQTTGMSTPLSTTDGFITRGEELFTSNESSDFDRRQSNTTKKMQDTALDFSHRNIYMSTNTFSIRVTTGSGQSNEATSQEIQDNEQLETTSRLDQRQMTRTGKFTPITTDFVHSAESVENNVGSTEEFLTSSKPTGQTKMTQYGGGLNTENATVASPDRRVMSNNNFTPILNYVGNPGSVESIEENVNSIEISRNGNKTTVLPNQSETGSMTTDTDLLNSGESNEQNITSSEDLTTSKNNLDRYSTRIQGSGETGSNERTTNQQAVSSTTNMGIVNSAESIEENINSGENVTTFSPSAYPTMVGSGEAASNEITSTTQHSQTEMMSIALSNDILNSMESAEQDFGSSENITALNPTSNAMLRSNAQDSPEASSSENTTTSGQTQSGIMPTTKNSNLLNSAESFEQGFDSGENSTSSNIVKQTIGSAETRSSGTRSTNQPRLGEILFGGNSFAPITRYSDFSNSQESVEGNSNSGEIIPLSYPNQPSKVNPNVQPDALYFTPPTDLTPFNETSQYAMVRGINIPTFRSNRFGGTSISNNLLGITMNTKLQSTDARMTSKAVQITPHETVGMSSRTWVTVTETNRKGAQTSDNRWHTNPYSTTPDHHDSFEVTKPYQRNKLTDSTSNSMSTRVSDRELYSNPTVMRNMATKVGRKTSLKPNNHLVSSSSEQDTASREIDGGNLYSSLASSIPYTYSLGTDMRTRTMALTKALDLYDSTTRPLVTSDGFGATGSFGRETRYTGDPYYYDSTVGMSRTPMFSRGLTTLSMRTRNPSSSKSRLLTSIGPRMASTTVGRSPFRQSQELFGASNFISPWLPSTRYKLPLQTGQVTKSIATDVVTGKTMVTRVPAQTVPPKPGFNYLWSLGKDVLTSLFQGSNNVKQPDAKWKDKTISSTNTTIDVLKQKAAATSVQFRSMHGGEIKPKEEFGAFGGGSKVVIPLREVVVTTPVPVSKSNRASSGSIVKRMDSGTISNGLDSVKASNRMNSGVISNRLNSGTISNSLDSVTVSNRINSGMISNELNSETTSNSLDSGTVLNAINSGVSSKIIYSGLRSNMLDSGKVSNMLDTGTVSNRLGSSVTSKQLKSGTISTSTSSTSSTKSSQSSTQTRKSIRTQQASSSINAGTIIASVTEPVRMNAQ